MRYSVLPRDPIFTKGYIFWSFDKSRSKNVGKNTTKNLSCKNSQKLLHQAKQFATDALKPAARRAIKKNSRNNR